MEGRWRGDGGEMEGRWRGDGGEMEGRWRGERGRKTSVRTNSLAMAWCFAFIVSIDV